MVVVLRWQADDVFAVRPSRSRDEIHHLPCDVFSGIMVTDPAKLIARYTVTTADNRTDAGLKIARHLWNL